MVNGQITGYFPVYAYYGQIVKRTSFHSRPDVYLILQKNDRSRVAEPIGFDLKILTKSEYTD